MAESKAKKSKKGQTKNEVTSLRRMVQGTVTSVSSTNTVKVRVERKFHTKIWEDCKSTQELSS